MIENKEEFPLITVITPSYNGPYLIDAIKSVLMQTYPKIEYIITDDASTNFPEEEIQQLLSQNSGNIVSWQILRKEQNVGTVKNLNSAIQVSHGKYIFFLAHDDCYFETETISKLVTFFEETKALVITGFCEAYNIDMSVALCLYPNMKRASKIKAMSSKNLYYDLCYKYYIPGACLAYSRKCIDTYGLFDEKYRILEDWPMIMKLLRENVKIYFWDGIIIKYRQNSGGVSTGSQTNLLFLEEYLQCQRTLLHTSNGLRKMKILLYCKPLHYYVKNIYYLKDVKTKDITFRSHNNLSKIRLNYELWKNKLFGIMRNTIR